MSTTNLPPTFYGPSNLPNSAVPTVPITRAYLVSGVTTPCIVAHWEHQGTHYCGDAEGRVYEWWMDGSGWREVCGPIAAFLASAPVALPILADAPEQVGTWINASVWRCRCKPGQSRDYNTAGSGACYRCHAVRPAFEAASPASLTATPSIP